MTIYRIESDRFEDTIRVLVDVHRVTMGDSRTADLLVSLLDPLIEENVHVHDPNSPPTSRYWDPDWDGVPDGSERGR